MDFELLSGLREEDRRAVLSTANRRRFKRNEIVFHEGDPGDTFHLIAKGRVAVRVSTPSGDVATLAVLGAGDGFGEGVFLDPSARRTASIQALESTETLGLARGPFEDLRRTHPTVEDLLLQHMARQVRRLSSQLTEALYIAADTRVLRRLLNLNEIYAGGEIPLTQEDLATMAGTTRPTANRALQAAVAAGAVELSRGRMSVVDRAILERLAR